MLIGITAAAVLTHVCLGATDTQTDWSGGPGIPGPVTAWNARFDSASGTSWRSVPGQLALSSAALPLSVKHPLASGLTVAGGAYVCDVDGDGDADMVNTQYKALDWWERQPDNTWVIHVVVTEFWGLGAGTVTSADVDNDGDTDLITTSSYGPPDDGANGRVTWFENLNGIGTAWTTHVVEEQFYGANTVIVVDVDGDGDLDFVSDAYLAYSIPGTDDVIWLENADGVGGSWIHHTIDANYQNPLSVDLTDVDGDGDLDIVGTSAGIPGPNLSNIVWWENKTVALPGAGPWVRHILKNVFSYAVGAAAVDMDGDGDPDVVCASYDQNQVAWFENTNPFSTNWTMHLIANFAHPISVKVADLDGDGDLDVFGTTTFVGTDPIVWWQNTAGTGLMWTQKTVIAALGYPTIAAGDVNQDGKLEIVATEQGTSAGQGKIWWWDITQFIPSGTLTSSILDGGGVDPWDSLELDATVPASTTLSIEVRASDDSSTMGRWVAAPAGPLSGVIDTTLRYLQYRLTPTTADLALSPIVRDVSVTTAASGLGPDLNSDGAVNGADVALLLGAWNTPDADLDGDGNTDGADITILLGAWTG